MESKKNGTRDLLSCEISALRLSLESQVIPFHPNRPDRCFLKRNNERK